MRIRDLYVLKASQIRSAKPGKLSDGGGLCLLTKPNGKQYWRFIYKQQGKQSTVALGSAEIVSLANARDKAATCRAAVLAGEDPKLALITVKVEDDNGPTFKDVALEYIANNEAGWKSDDYRNQWKNTMRDYVYPYIGSRPIAEITNEDIYQLLRLIWMTKNPTASKLRGRIEKVFGFARVRKFYLHPNPAVWADNLEHLLGKPGKIHRVEHHEAMDIDDIPELMRHLEERHNSPRSPNSATQAPDGGDEGLRELSIPHTAANQCLLGADRAKIR